MAAELQSFLRFLTADAKIPLSTAIGKVRDLQAANLSSADAIAKVKPQDLETYFPGDENEKTRKQIITAAKRVSKKRTSTDPNATPSPKKQRKDSQPLFQESQGVLSPEDLEASLSIPAYNPSTSISPPISQTHLHTNRAPLVLAFVLTLLKHLHPTQPLSSRLSLAQAYVSTTSRTRAVYLGLETGKSAEEEGWGEGQPSITIMGKKLAVLRRWGYPSATTTTTNTNQGDAAGQEEEEEEPPLWALDLESLKNSNTTSSSRNTNTHSNLPIYTPQSARNYLLKACEGVDGTGKKVSAGEKGRLREENLSKLLFVLERVYESWKEAGLGPTDLEARTWGWYVRVRPEVAEGVAGWGGKNTLRLGDILALANETAVVKGEEGEEEESREGDDGTGVKEEER